MERVYYLRARVDGAANGGAVAADFYVLAEDTPTAGAVAHDLCRERGWTFASYLALAQVLEPSHENEEITRAIKLANEVGYAVVLSALEAGEDE